MSNIEVEDPDWVSLPPECPGCDRAILNVVEDLNDLVVEYQDGESEHGDYREAVCAHCGVIFDRHYGEADADRSDVYASPDDWVFRAQELHQHTSLSEREAHVRALQERGFSHAGAAEVLGIEPSTVGEYSRRIDRRIREAEGTLSRMRNDVRITEVLERQFDGFAVMPHSSFPCQSCNTSLETGDGAVLMFERTNQWQVTDVFCADCDRDDYITAVHGQALSLDEFVEAGREYDMDYAIVAGTLGELGEDPADEKSWFSAGSLTLEDPTLLEVLR